MLFWQVDLQDRRVSLFLFLAEKSLLPVAFFFFLVSQSLLPSLARRVVALVVVPGVLVAVAAVLRLLEKKVERWF